MKQVCSWGNVNDGKQTQKSTAIDTIHEMTKQDKILQMVKERIRDKDWDHYKSDPFIRPFYPARAELSEIVSQNRLGPMKLKM